MSRPKATQLWSSTSKKNASSFVEDKTWMCPYIHTGPKNTNISFKVGNKEYALKAVAEGDKRTISELQLKRKYRYLLLNLTSILTFRINYQTTKK